LNFSASFQLACLFAKQSPLFLEEGRNEHALLIESDTISENNRCLLECLTKKAYLGDFVKSPLSCPKRVGGERKKEQGGEKS